MKKLVLGALVFSGLFILGDQSFVTADDRVTYATLQAVDNPNEVSVYKVENEDIENEDIDFQALKAMSLYASTDLNSKNLSYYGEWTEKEMEKVKERYAQLDE
jgi:hypothetical protein